MAGTKAGGAKAAATNKLRYGETFYADIGRVGGTRGHTGGFAHYHTCAVFPYEHRIASCAGIKGGRKSRRGPVKDTAVVGEEA